jgi:cytochrome c oxidase subunit 1
MFMSLVMFGFLGGISGVVMGTEQINLIMHNTLYVPGHFHATVVAGTTLAFMAITYLLVPLIFRREVMFKKIAQLQPYVFGLGIAGISLFMMGAGTLGVPRRHWDITFADALSQVQFSPAAFLMLALNGLSAIMAATGGAMYIVVVVCSVFFGRKIGDNEVVQLGPVSGAESIAAVARYGNEGTLKIPGTVVLVGVFFVSFVLYYFVNWKYLAEVWPLR